MSMNDGGPAFPQNDARVNRINNLDGMSLRDYFAAKAMQTMLLNDLRKDAWAHTDALAIDAYKMADAMLKERDK